jgi:DNA-binding NarL/FixJ family response regulator
MGVSPRTRPRLGIVSRDALYSRPLADWLAATDDELDVAAPVASWADLLTDPAARIDLVVLDASGSRRPLEAQIRSLRASGAKVVVVTEPGGSGDDARRATTAGAFCVLGRDVPFGLIDEMARAAVGLPLRGGAA